MQVFLKPIAALSLLLLLLGGVGTATAAEFHTIRGRPLAGQAFMDARRQVLLRSLDQLDAAGGSSSSEGEAAVAQRKTKRLPEDGVGPARSPAFDSPVFDSEKVN